MLNFIQFLDSLRDLSEEDIRKAVIKKIESNETEVKSYSSFIKGGNIVDLQVGDSILCGIVLSNKSLMLIDPETHVVKGYLKHYTDITPYEMLRIRQPNQDAYKYSDDNIPVVWEKENQKTEMSLQDIENALGIKSGTLVIK